MSNWQDDLENVLVDWSDREIGSLVVSPDVDGLVCAALLAREYDVEIVGIYSSQHLLMLDGYSTDDARNALWLDHDISHPDVACIGQHLVMHRSGDSLPLRSKTSFNPNIWAQQAWENSFKGIAGKQRDKFPLGTVHFLADYLGFEPESDLQLATMAHCDGTWFVAQIYEPNYRIWQRLMFPNNDLVEAIGPDYPSNDGATRAHAELVDALLGAGIRKSVSRSPRAAQLPDDLRALTGNQSVKGQITRDPDKFLDNFHSALSLICEIIDADVPSGTTAGLLVSGTRESVYPNRIDDFDTLMSAEEIFSHAFTDFRTLSYTVGMSL